MEKNHHGRINKANYEIKKRNPPKQTAESYKRSNKFYITKKTHIESQTKKVVKMLEDNSEEAIIYGLGNSLNRALVLALEVQKYFMGAMQFSITTSTIKVTDDIFPLSDEYEIGHVDRPISSVCITFFPNSSS